MASRRKPKSEKIKFKYVIPDHITDNYVNGVFGGTTPRQEIHMHFFSERNPIPKAFTLELAEKDKLPKEIELIKGGDVVRLIQASIIMNLNTAVSIRDWLNDRIKHLEPTENKDINKKPKKSQEKK